MGLNRPPKELWQNSAGLLRDADDLGSGMAECLDEAAGSKLEVQQLILRQPRGPFGVWNVRVP